MRYKKLVTYVKSHASTVSLFIEHGLLVSGESRYKSEQQSHIHETLL